MSKPNVLESLPDRAMKQSEIETLGDGDAVDWVEPLWTGTGQRRNMVSAWALEASGTAYVLMYEIDGWASQGTFDPEGLSADEKSDRAEEILND